MPQTQLSRWPKTCGTSPGITSMAFVLDDKGSLYTCNENDAQAHGDYSSVTRIDIAADKGCGDFLFEVTNLAYSGGAAVVFRSGSITYYAGGQDAPQPTTYPYRYLQKTDAYARWAQTNCIGFEDNYSQDDYATLAKDLVGTNAFLDLEGFYAYPFTSSKKQEWGQEKLCVLVKNPTCK